MVEIRDKRGQRYHVIPFGFEGLHKLLSFYDAFEPKGVYQGIPPSRKSDRHQWVKSLMAGSQNFFILEGDQLIGHVAVTHGGGGLPELIIFLQEGYRGRGVGTEALRQIRTLLANKGHDRIWLTVQSTNVPAIRCFRKVGFHFTSPELEPERDMLLGSEEKL